MSNTPSDAPRKVGADPDLRLPANIDLDAPAPTKTGSLSEEVRADIARAAQGVTAAGSADASTPRVSAARGSRGRV